MGSQIALLIVSAIVMTVLWRRLSLGSDAKVAALAAQVSAVTKKIEAYQARAAKLRRALDAAKIVVSEIDTATHAVKRNPLSATAERAGHSIAPFDPHADFACVDRADLETLLARQRDLRNGESPVQVEFRITTPDGAASHLLSVATRTSTATIVCVSIDITTLRTAELARQTHRERVQRALDASNDCFYEIDLTTGDVWLAQPSDMLGYSEKDAGPFSIGANTLHHADDHETINEALRRHLAGETRLCEFEYRIRAANGEWVWCSSKGSAERDETGRATRLSGVARDISEKKEFQRTLILAREAAAAANRAKGEFLANMSHEIRTPMNGVIGMTDMLLDTELDTLQRDYAETVLECSKSLLAVINDVLDFSKLEAKKLELEIIDVDLRATLLEVEHSLAVQASAKGLDLKLQADPALPMQVRGDPGRIQQILLNLGRNAIKFTQQGSVTIDIQLLERATEGVRIRCEVRDTGVGIPSERLGSLFEPFSQIDASRTRKHGGAGLGLCIVRRLVELMGGETGVTSQQGVGSSFWFTAHFAEVSASEREPIRKQRAVPLEHTHEKRILIVDDNAVNRRVTQRLLAKLGCNADSVTNGKDAITAWESDRYHLILMDCQMPEMDGFEATRQIRRREAGVRRIPIVALTAEVNRAIDAECAAAGMDDTLAKPLDRALLQATLSRYLAEQRAQPGEEQ